MECVENCEFLKFKGGKFMCDFYDDVGLYSEKTLSINDPDNIKIFRCERCKDEELIGSNNQLEMSRKIKQRLGWIMDSFYSFKDDIENEHAKICKILNEK